MTDAAPDQTTDTKPTDGAVNATTSGGDAPVKSPYPPAAAQPVLIGPDGIRFDFNLGCRVLLPPRIEGKWRVRLRDLDTGNILFESENKGAFVNSAKRWFVRFRVEVWSIDDDRLNEPRPVMTHDFDPRHQDVLIQFPVGTLGDILAWFPYAPASPRNIRIAASPALCPA